MDSYDNWKTSPPEPSGKVVGQCAYDHCPNPDILDGDDIYRTTGGDDVHENCWDDYAKYELGAVRMIACPAEGGDF